MDEILIACGDVELLKKIVAQVPDDQFKPIATKTGRGGIVDKVRGRDVGVALVHEHLADDASIALCRALQQLDSPPGIVFLAEAPPEDGPFDTAIRYPVPGPVLRNAIDRVRSADDDGEDLDKWKDFYGEVKERLDAVSEQDYYEMLRLPADAPHHAVVKAFDRVSLRYHPDRYKQFRDRRWGKALHKKTNKLYTILTEAYQVLSDRKLRQRYDELRAGGDLRMPPDELSSPESGPSSLTEAANSAKTRKFLEMAQTEIAKKNWDAALQNLEFASSMEPDNGRISQKIDEIEAKLE
ncbi:MAG: J domain-containing protein [Bradymonadaceae bacterium]